MKGYRIAVALLIAHSFAGIWVRAALSAEDVAPDLARIGGMKHFKGPDSAKALRIR
jgi:hypothetical protein